MVFPVVDLFFGPANMTHKLSSACAETELSPLPQQIFSPITGTCHVTALCGCVVVCFLCGLFLFVFVFGVVFAFGSLCFGSCSLVT